MFWLNSPIPYAMSGQRMRFLANLQAGWDIHNHIASELVASDVTDQTNSRVCLALSNSAFCTLCPISVYLHWTPKNAYIGTFKLGLKLAAQQWPHDSAAHIATAVATDENKHVLDVLNPVKEALVCLCSGQPISVDW